MVVVPECDRVGSACVGRKDRVCSFIRMGSEAGGAHDALGLFGCGMLMMLMIGGGVMSEWGKSCCDLERGRSRDVREREQICSGGADERSASVHVA